MIFFSLSLLQFNDAYRILFVCFSAEDAVEKQQMSSDSSAPASVRLEGNGHPAKKHEVLSCCSVVISAFVR